MVSVPGQSTPNLSLPTGNQPAQPVMPGQPISTPTPETPTKATAIVSAKPAQEDLTNIQTQVSDLTKQVQDFNIQKTQQQQLADQQAKDKAAAEAKTAQTVSPSTLPSGAPTYGLDYNKLTQQQLTNVMGNDANGVTMNPDGTFKIDTNSPYIQARLSGLDSNTAAQFNTDVVMGRKTLDDLKATTAPSTLGGTQVSGQSIASIEAARDQSFSDYKTQINSINNGTFPLTDAERGQLDSVNTTYDRLVAQQKIANANYEGGMRTYTATTGEQETSPKTAMGEIQSAIDSGLSKIADIESKRNDALTTLKKAIQDNDYKNVKDAYDEFSNYADKKELAIKAINDDLSAKEKDARDFNYKATQDSITNTIASDKFTYQQKQDAITNALEKGKFDETKRAALVKEAQDQQQLNFTTGQLQSPGSNGSHPVVNMTSNNTPDKVAQASYLDSLPGGASGELSTLIKGIANYSINPSSVPTRNYRGVGGLTQSQVLTLVSQYDPTFEQGQYNARQALQTNFKSGKYSQNINALNTAIGHIVDLSDNSKIGNWGLPSYNLLKNTVESALGMGQIGKAKLNISAATGELATVFKSAGATDQEIKNLGTVDVNSSPDQFKNYIEVATQLLSSRLDALNETYSSGMGKSPDKSFLSPTSQESLLKLQQSGLNIQVPDLANSPILKIQTFHDSSPENAKILDTIHQSAPSATPDEIADILAQNGIQL